MRGKDRLERIRHLEEGGKGAYYQWGFLSFDILIFFIVFDFS